MSKEERASFLKQQREATATAEPGLIAKAWKFSEAVVRWELAGKPTRSQEEIDDILAICRECPFYIDDGKRARCKKCGCNINAQANGHANKLAMATESCPLDPPKWATSA